MVKKVLSILLVFCLILISFASCKKDDKKTTASTAAKTSSTAAKTTAPTKLSTSSTSSTPAATVVDTGKVTDYSIELDFKIISQVAGIVFAYVDDTQFLMFQFNTWDFGDNPDKAIAEADKKVYFRPCIYNTSWTIIDKDISDVIKWEDRTKVQHLKITVSAANEINTYINNVLIDTFTDEAAAYGMFGFRQCNEVATIEEAAYDNIVIKNTANNHVIYQENFDSNVNPFPEGEIKAGLINDSLALDIAILLGANFVNVIEQ